MNATFGNIYDEYLILFFILRVGPYGVIGKEKVNSSEYVEQYNLKIY